MKVAQLLASVERTGVEAHVRVLCVALRRLGVESILVCPGPGPLTQWLVERDVPVRIFRVDDYGAPSYPELVLATTRSLARQRPELVKEAVSATRRPCST